MSEIFNKFNIFSKVTPKLKETIKIFHVFDDQKGLNILFITSDDKVFGFGVNTYGCCGLGHNSVVNEPQVIPELCNKNIKQFFIGFSFVLALSGDHQLYGWGNNSYGQLGRGSTSDGSIYLKPECIDFSYETIIEVSCGSYHTLALTLEGNVYGSGLNDRGQIGCGKEKGEIIPKPIRLNFFEKISIKSIYCSYCRSYALTNNGLVYSWGNNKWCYLGHELDINERVFEPKLINISNVISVSMSSVNTYLLTNEGLIYFCGKYEDQNNCETFQKSPKLMNSKIKFSSLHSVPIYQKLSSIASAVSETQIYYLNWNKVSKIERKNIFDYYCNEWNVCHKTIQILDNNKYKESEVNLFKMLSKMDSRFGDIFTQKKVLGRGGYGVVYKVQNNYNKKLFAVKKVSTKNFSDDENEELMREVNTLSKCSAEYVVQYFDSWFENKCFYIQTELCSENLRSVIKNIIDEKPDYFGRKQNEAMNTIEYLISCQLFKEVLECVQYLHESNPKIMHRDIKPENILITKNTNNHRFLKLCDFGLAKFIKANITKTHTRDQGTTRYMAPEIMKQNPKYNEKVDIYSLGYVAQDLFDFDINDSSNPLNNSLFNEKGRKLNEIIKKMVNPIYSERPTCAQVLSRFTDWSISLDEFIKIDFCYEEVLICDSFFKSYFNTILLRNVFPNNSNQSYNKSLSSDVTFVVSGQQITCNKHILMIKNQEFKRIIGNIKTKSYVNILMNYNTNDDLIIKELHHVAFKKMIDYLYFNQDTIINENNSVQELFDIYKCGLKYKITSLIELIENRLSLIIDLDNFVIIYNFSKQLKSKKLNVSVKQFMQANFTRILDKDLTELKRINTNCDNFLFECSVHLIKGE